MEERGLDVGALIGFDGIAIISLLERFQRDAFGVLHYRKRILASQQANRIDDIAAASLSAHLCGLGIRINSDNPRKTRVAAAFSLWFSAVRPLYLKSGLSAGLSNREMMVLPARCNFWIACQFLRKFGDIDYGSGKDKEERLRRIEYDLTYRDLNLSSLEMLYCSILRTNVAGVPTA